MSMKMRKVDTRMLTIHEWRTTVGSKKHTSDSQLFDAIKYINGLRFLRKS